MPLYHSSLHKRTPLTEYSGSGTRNRPPANPHQHKTTGNYHNQKSLTMIFKSIIICVGKIKNEIYYNKKMKGDREHDSTSLGRSYFRCNVSINCVRKNRKAYCNIRVRLTNHFTGIWTFNAQYLSNL